MFPFVYKCQRGSPPLVLSESVSCNTIALLWNCIVSLRSCEYLMTQCKWSQTIYVTHGIFVKKTTAKDKLGGRIESSPELCIYLLAWPTDVGWRFGAIDPFSAGPTPTRACTSFHYSLCGLPETDDLYTTTTRHASHKYKYIFYFSE